MDPNWCKGFGGTSDDPASCMELASLRGVIRFGVFRFRFRVGTGMIVFLFSGIGLVGNCSGKGDFLIASGW